MSKRKNNKTKKNVAIVVVLIIWIVVCGYLVKNYKSSSQTTSIGAQSKEEPKQDSVATIVAMGDTLCHSQNFKDAYDSETGVYDFSPMFKYVTKYYDDATVAVGNLEATLAGPERGYSGYPTFNTPEHLAIDLKELGLDIMTTANNHTLDIGYTGLESSLNYLDEAGLEHTGSARSKEEQDKILFKDLNGIKTAFLAFTYGTNGIPVPEGKEYCVNVYADWAKDWSSYTIDYDFMKSKIDQAKAQGAEAIVVSMHWGVEYQTKENAEQDKLADFLIANDVNVILGCHPHVPQPMEMRTVTADDGTEKTGFVIFSMGNFFSAQTFDNTRNTLILNVRIRKNAETGKITIDQATYAPLYVYDNGLNAKDRYEILDLDEIIRSYEAGETTWSENMYNLAVKEKARLEKIVGPNIYNNITENDKAASKTDISNNVNN